MSKMIFVNLCVADVEKSAAFYEAIGFEREMRFSQPGTAAAMRWSDTILFMLLTPDFFGGFTPRPIADARATTEVLLALSMPDRAAVDAIVDAAAANGGGGDIREKQDLGFMYGRTFEDLDGHIFEPHFMDQTAFAAQVDQKVDA